MKIIATLLAIGLVAGCNTALAAGASDASDSDPVNPFGGPLNIGAGGPRIMVSGEDLANPFSDAHPMEQGLYESLYYNHYHWLFYNVNAPAPQEMPSTFDAKGRPLWFDGLRGGTSLQLLVAGLFVREQFDDLIVYSTIGTIPLTGWPMADGNSIYSISPCNMSFPTHMLGIPVISAFSVGEKSLPSLGPPLSPRRSTGIDTPGVPEATATQGL